MSKGIPPNTRKKLHKFRSRTEAYRIAVQTEDKELMKEIEKSGQDIDKVMEGCNG